MPECWGESELLKKLLLAEETVPLVVAHLHKGRPRPKMQPSPVTKQELELYFWARVDFNPDGCWLWNAKTGTTGYGEFRCYGRLLRSNRTAWEFVHGPIPNDLWVLHKCDVRRCVRPDHLFLGTYLDNIADKVAKNRSHRPRGEKSAVAILKEANVIEIRAMLSNGATLRTCAEKFNVSWSCIMNIKNGRRWGWMLEQKPSII